MGEKGTLVTKTNAEDAFLYFLLRKKQLESFLSLLLRVQQFELISNSCSRWRADEASNRLL